MRALFRTYLLSSSLSPPNLLRTTLSVDEPPLRVYRYLSRSIPHFQWKGRISPFRIDGGEALGFIFLAHPHPLFQGEENDIHTEIHIRKVYRLRLPNSRQSESKFRTSGGDQRRRDLHVHVGL